MEDTTNEDALACEDTLCEICMIAPKKYKCPRCSKFTCSLDCCKAHKAKFGCNGQRDRAKYVSCSEFNENNMRSDYHFLEDVLQCKDKSRRTFSHTGPSKRRPDIIIGSREPASESNDSSGASKGIAWPTIVLPTSTITGVPLPVHNKNLKKLVEKALERGTRLVTMPPMMSKREANTTRLHHRPSSEDTIQWKVGLVYVVSPTCNPAFVTTLDFTNNALRHIDPEKGIVSICLTAVDENSTIESIISQGFNNIAENAVIRHALRSLRPLFQSNELRILFHSIPSPANNPVFYEAPLEFTLKTALYARTVIEHPIIYVGSLHDTSHFNTFISTMPSYGAEIVNHGASTELTPLVAGAMALSPLKRKLNEATSEEEDIILKKRAEYEEDGGVVEDEMESDEDLFFQNLQELENAPVEQLMKIINEDV